MMIRYCVIIFALIGILPVTFAQNSEVDELYEKAVEAYWNNEHILSIDYFDTIIELNPNYANVYAYRGSLYRIYGDLDTAFSNFETGLKIEETALLYAMRARAFSDMGDIDNALMDIEQALKLDPDDHVVRYNAARIEDEYNNPSAAIRYLTAIIDSGVDFSPAYTERAAAYWHLGQYEEALQDYNEAVLKFPNDGNVWARRGQFYYEIVGDWEQARDDYNYAVSLGQQSFVPYALRGTLLSNSGELNAAIADYDTALKYYSHYDTAYLNRGLTYAQLGNFDAALGDMSKAIELDPQNGHAYYNRGVVYRMMGNNLAAIEDYTSAIQYAPEFQNSYINRASAYLDTYQYELAEDDYDILLQRFLPNHPTILVGRGIARSGAGNHEGAVEDFSLAIEVNPYEKSNYRSRALDRAYLGLYEEALSDIEEALRLDPNYAGAYEVQAYIYDLMGDPEKAEAARARMIELQGG